MKIFGKSLSKYKGYSINKVNFPLGVANWKHCIVAPFQENQVMSPFMPQNDFDCCAWNFFLPESMFPLHELFLTQACSGKPVLLFRKHFLTKTWFPGYITLVFCKFYKVCISQPLNIWWQTSVQAWSILLDLQPLWIASKQRDDYSK